MTALEDLSVGDRVKAQPVVGKEAGGTMHEIFHGVVDELHPADEHPFEGEDVVMVDPDGGDGPRPVRASNVERHPEEKRPFRPAEDR